MLHFRIIKKMAAFAVSTALLISIAGCGIDLTADRTEYVLLGGNSGNVDYDNPDATTPQWQVGGPDQDAQMVEETPITGKLTVQIFINENGVGEEAWTRILDDFEKANPDLELTTYIGPNVNSQLASKWNSGKDTPDIVLLDGKGLSEYSMSAAGSFLDLTDWYQNATVYGTNVKIRDKVNTDALELYNDCQYKAPLMLNCYGLWYDEASYQAMGISVHGDFAGMLSNGEVLKQNWQTSLIYPGMYSNYLVWGTVMPSVAAYGQEFFNRVASGRDPEVYEDERFVGIMNNLQTFSQAGYISASATQDHLGAQSDWLNHRAALVSSGIWLEAEMKNSIPGNFDMRFTTAGLNASGQNPGIALMGVGVAVSANTQNEENAKNFLRYLYRDENLNHLAISYGYVSASKWQPEISAYSPISQKVMEYIRGEDVTVVYKTCDWGNVGETFNNVANQIAQGSLTVEQGIKQLKEAAQKNS